MKRIDSHQHFWNYDPSKQVWMTEKMTALQKDFTPQDLEPLLAKFGLDGCVAVQASQSEAENNYLLELGENSPLIKGIVGWVDLQSPQVNERLDYYKQFKIIKGFRHVIHDEEDLDFMLRQAFLGGLKQLAAYQFTYDLLIFPCHLVNTSALIEKLPAQAFVIDHIAKPDIRNQTWRSWRKDLSVVAQNKNVFCKISGLTTEANWNVWTQETFRIYLDVVVELFGIDRIMFGSDWPVCTLASSYEKMYAIVNNYFSAFSKSEQEKFFGLNAIHFYDL